MRIAPGAPDDGLSFELDASDRATGDPELVVDVGGFEGPLDLLLDLAHRQKVDLHQVSILALAEQYLAFIANARDLRLELAADYLVMAAWLAFLKSRLLLPEPPKPEGPSAGDLATALALRLRRLDAVREAARRLAERSQLGRDVFARGRPAPVPDDCPVVFTASLHDLLAAYARGRQRSIVSAPVTMAARQVWSLAEARDALERLIGTADGWTELDRHLAGPVGRPTVMASALAAALELVREGRAILRQDGAFAPLMVKRREPMLRVVSP